MNSTDEALKQLNKKVVQLYQNKKYAEAIEVGIQALNLGEKKLGAEHPNTASALNNLALLYDKVGDHARAEPLHRWNQQLFVNKTWEAQAV